MTLLKFPNTCIYWNYLDEDSSLDQNQINLTFFYRLGSIPPLWVSSAGARVPFLNHLHVVTVGLVRALTFAFPPFLLPVFGLFRKTL